MQRARSRRGGGAGDVLAAGLGDEVAEQLPGAHRAEAAEVDEDAHLREAAEAGGDAAARPGNRSAEAPCGDGPPREQPDVVDSALDAVERLAPFDVNPGVGRRGGTREGGRGGG